MTLSSRKDDQLARWGSPHSMQCCRTHKRAGSRSLKAKIRPLIPTGHCILLCFLPYFISLSHTTEPKQHQNLVFGQENYSCKASQKSKQLKLLPLSLQVRKCRLCALWNWPCQSHVWLRRPAWPPGTSAAGVLCLGLQCLGARSSDGRHT